MTSSVFHTITRSSYLAGGRETRRRGGGERGRRKGNPLEGEDAARCHQFWDVWSGCPGRGLGCGAAAEQGEAGLPPSFGFPPQIWEIFLTSLVSWGKYRWRGQALAYPWGTCPPTSPGDPEGSERCSQLPGSLLAPRPHSIPHQLLCGAGWGSPMPGVLAHPPGVLWWTRGTQGTQGLGVML